MLHTATPSTPPAMRSPLAIAVAALTVAAPLASQTPSHHTGLGSLAFPTSGAPEAQRDFERGVLLMHSFEYDGAAGAFRAAQEKDPDFAMAYWGEAMTHNHPVWNEHDREAALEILARYAPTAQARRAKAPTPRERAYLEAVDVLYGEGRKERRDTLYSRAMSELVAAYPEDSEARAFHALAILGESRGDRDIPSYMRAGAIALDLFEANPDHPGAAHYVIHAFDDPEHAPLGLEAAYAYSEVAPDAGHAQHMTTHIFLAMGMWDGVVANNIRADAVVDRGLAARGMPPTSCGHYNEWLAYGYAMQGREGDAEALVLACLEQAAATPAFAASAEGMRALHVATMDDLDGAVARGELPGGGNTSVLTYQDWTAGIVAARTGDVVEAQRRLAAIEERLDSGAEFNEFVAPYAPVWRGTLAAEVAEAAGARERAIAEARAAAEYEASLPLDFGPPIAKRPARELEADLLLRAGRADEALAAYRLQLARTPRRSRTLEGFARAAEAAGHGALAEGARSELAAIRAVTEGLGGGAR